MHSIVSAMILDKDTYPPSIILSEHPVIFYPFAIISIPSVFSIYFT
jgi:hypothetical protein